MRMHRITFGIVAALIPLGMLSAKPSVHLTHPPPGRYGVEDLWKARVRTSDPADTARDAWFEGVVYEQTRGDVKVFDATTKPFRLSLGLKTYQYRDVRVDKTWTAPGYEVFVTRSGHLPAGNYRFKLKLQPFEVEDSFAFAVKPVGPPRLISPPEGARLAGPYPDFVWTAPAGYRGRATYKLRIVEVRPGQTKEEALRVNRPWYEQKGINSTRLRYPTRARKLDENRKYAWQVSALGKGIQPLVSDRRGFRRAFSTPPMKFINPLKVSREVDRYGNYFVVRLTLRNVGSQSITNIVATDSHKYFQCIDDARKRRVPPPGGEQVPGWTTGVEDADCSVRSAGGGFRGITEIDLGNWVLPPGLSFTVYYSVVPLLTFSLTGPGHTIGSGLKVTYEMGGNQHARSYPLLAKTPVPGLADAWKAADYMIVTCPSKLQGSATDIDQVLVKMADMAKLEDGALLYFTGSLNSAPVARSVMTAMGTMLKGHWYTGYLLIVGEDDVVPAWTAPGEDFGGTIIAAHVIDLPYADWNADLAPNLRIGRIIGPTARELLIPLQNTLDIRRHHGCTYDASNALFLSGPERCWEIFAEDMHQGSQYAAALHGISTSTLHTEYITTRRKVAMDGLWIVEVADGGAHPDSSLNSFTNREIWAWLVQIKQGLPAAESGDHHFTDTEGRARRVPHAWNDYTLYTKACPIGEQLDHARRGAVYGTYFYSHEDDWNEVEKHIRFVLRPNIRNRDIVVWVGHSWSGSWGSVLESPAQVAALDFATSNNRPLVIAFGCHSGHYDATNSISRAFMEHGAAVYVGSTESMFPDGDDVLKFRFWDHWNKQTSIGDAMRSLKIDMAHNLPMDKGLRLFLREINTYGDPKFGGN